MLYNAAVSFINNAQQFATEKKSKRKSERRIFCFCPDEFPEQLNNSDSYIAQNLLSN